jgi:SagB-type dehydrogenase family enzyme
VKIEWTNQLGAGLHDASEESIAFVFHENTKLSTNNAMRLSAQFQISAFESFVSTRGFRHFQSAKAIPLPEPNESTALTQSVMLNRRSRRNLLAPISITQLGTVLGQALGVNSLFRNDEAQIAQPLRSCPSAGGLYPLDTYLIAQRVEDINAGVYYFNPLAHQLELLNSRSISAILEEGFFHQQWLLSAALVIVFVASFDRTIAKYGERGYRLTLLDAGHAAQNVLLVAEQERLSACAVGGFCDDSLAKDLQLDGTHEAVVHVIALGGDSE